MKLFRQLLDLLNGLIKAWPTIVIILGCIISAALWIFHMGQTSVDISMPLSLLIAVAALALYPIAKLVQSVVSKMRKPPFEYQGLLWKPSLFSFVYPHPLCPAPGCGLRIISFIVPPRPIQVVQGAADLQRMQVADSYEYECPIHGKIQSAPNLPLHELKMKARLVQRIP